MTIDDKKVNKPLVYIAIAATIVTAAWTVYRFFILPQNIQSQPTPVVVDEVFCTQDAKLCPDGTSVGRIPPDCEFKECPATGSANPQE